MIHAEIALHGGKMSRTARQSKILSLISIYDIDTQEDLARHLRQEGFEVTQATVSRDIKELGLVKSLGVKGTYRYTTKQTIDSTISTKLLNVVREATLSVVTAGNLVVVKTIGDGASAVSSAIEQILGADVVGMVADRNTILIVCMTEFQANNVANKVNQLL